jgi:plastocyanin
MTHRTKALTTGVLAAVAAGAAGATAVSAAGDGHAAAAQRIALSADKTKLKFNTSRLTARHGRVTLVMANPSSLPHGVAVQGKGINKKGKVVEKGGRSTVTVSLSKGTYTFYCPVPGHRAAGMQGKLIVK